MDFPVLAQVLHEAEQAAFPRQKLIGRLERTLRRCVLTYFTSFIYPVMVDDSDAQLLEDVLRHCNLDRVLLLVLNSPHGEALAAERIIRLCRSHV